VVAVFFYHIIKAFFAAFLRTRTGESGILGEVSHYAGVVETNGRGMLHLHGFIWLTGNLDFPMLQQKLLSDSEFKGRVVEYLQSIMNESVDEDAARAYSSQYRNETPRTDISGQDDKDWAECMKNHGNSVAYEKNMHSHTSSCYKYGYKRVFTTRKDTQGDDIEVDSQAGLGEEGNSGRGQGQ
jgi:Helitron helicase-like domain at N-terminus